MLFVIMFRHNTLQPPSYLFWTWSWERGSSAQLPVLIKSWDKVLVFHSMQIVVISKLHKFCALLWQGESLSTSNNSPSLSWVWEEPQTMTNCGLNCTRKNLWSRCDDKTTVFFTCEDVKTKANVVSPNKRKKLHSFFFHNWNLGNWTNDEESSWTIKKAFCSISKDEGKAIQRVIVFGFVGWKNKNKLIFLEHRQILMNDGLVLPALVWCDLTEYSLSLVFSFVFFLLCFFLICFVTLLFSHEYPNKFLEKTLWSSRCVLMGLKMLNTVTRLVFLVVLRTRSLLRIMRNKYKQCWLIDQILIYQRAMYVGDGQFSGVTWFSSSTTHPRICLSVKNSVVRANISQTSSASIAGTMTVIKHSNSTIKSNSMNTTQLFQTKDFWQANFLPPNQMNKKFKKRQFVLPPVAWQVFRQ